MGASPLVLCDDTPFVRAQDTANPYREVGKSLPMLSIPFSCLQRPNKRFQRADDVVEAIRCHPTDQRVDVMRTLGADVFTQNRHTLGRNRQFDLSARVLSDLTKPHPVAIVKPKRLRQTGPHGWGSLNAGVLRRISGGRLDRGKQSHQVGKRPAVEFLNRRDNPLAQLGVSMASLSQ